jgi:hypothetical protein
MGWAVAEEEEAAQDQDGDGAVGGAVGRRRMRIKLVLGVMIGASRQGV